MANRRSAKEWPPPRYPPNNLYKKFIQNGDMPITQIKYFSQKYAGGKAYKNIWTNESITNMIEMHKLKKQIGWYSLYEEDMIDEAISEYSVRNKDVAIIGSESPWVEAIILSKYPRSITTIEYGIIKSNISIIKTYTPHNFAHSYLKKEIKFDYVVSYSSIEHSGLGRYGDELDPDGDIHAVEEIWCMLKEGGYFLIGVPFSNKSFIRWNADRNYGPERMKYLAANFEQIKFFGNPWSGQIPLILKKENNEKCI